MGHIGYPGIGSGKRIVTPIEGLVNFEEIVLNTFITDLQDEKFNLGIS